MARKRPTTLREQMESQRQLEALCLSFAVIAFAGVLVLAFYAGVN